VLLHFIVRPNTHKLQCHWPSLGASKHHQLSVLLVVRWRKSDGDGLRVRACYVNVCKCVCMHGNMCVCVVCLCVCVHDLISFFTHKHVSSSSRTHLLVETRGTHPADYLLNYLCAWQVQATSWEAPCCRPHRKGPKLGLIRSPLQQCTPKRTTPVCNYGMKVLGAVACGTHNNTRTC